MKRSLKTALAGKAQSGLREKRLPDQRSWTFVVLPLVSPPVAIAEKRRFEISIKHLDVTPKAGPHPSSQRQNTSSQFFKLRSEIHRRIKLLWSDKIRISQEIGPAVASGFNIDQDSYKIVGNA